jgi:hypothetical protein
MKRKFIILLALLAVVFWAGSAMAYSFILDETNLSSSSYPPGYLQATVSLLSGTQAKVSVDSLLAGGYTYLFGQDDVFDFNVGSVAVTVGSINTSNSYSGFTPTAVTFAHTTGNNVDGGGLFDWIGSATTTGFPNAIDHLDFVLTRSSGTWTSEADVLTIAGITQPPHGTQYKNPALGHIMVWDGTTNSATITGYAYGQTVVPLPGAMLLLGAGLCRLAAYARRRQED